MLRGRSLRHTKHCTCANALLCACTRSCRWVCLHRSVPLRSAYSRARVLSFVCRGVQEGRADATLTPRTRGHRTATSSGPWPLSPESQVAATTSEQVEESQASPYFEFQFNVIRLQDTFLRSHSLTSLQLLSSSPGPTTRRGSISGGTSGAARHNRGSPCLPRRHRGVATVHCHQQRA